MSDICISVYLYTDCTHKIQIVHIKCLTLSGSLVEQQCSTQVLILDLAFSGWASSGTLETVAGVTPESNGPVPQDRVLLALQKLCQGSFTYSERCWVPLREILWSQEVISMQQQFLNCGGNYLLKQRAVDIAKFSSSSCGNGLLHPKIWSPGKILLSPHRGPTPRLQSGSQLPRAHLVRCRPADLPVDHVLPQPRQLKCLGVTPGDQALDNSHWTGRLSYSLL